MRLHMLVALGAAAKALFASGESSPLGLTFPSPPAPGLGAFKKLASLQCHFPSKMGVMPRRGGRHSSALRGEEFTPLVLPLPADVCQPPTTGQAYLGKKAVDLTHALPYDLAA